MIYKWLCMMPFPGGNHYVIEEERRSDGLRSELIIHDASPSDFTEYNCTVRNSHGQDTYIVRLERQSEFLNHLSMIGQRLKMYICRESSVDHHPWRGHRWHHPHNVCNAAHAHVQVIKETKMRIEKKKYMKKN